MLYERIPIQPDGNGTAVLTCFVKENTREKPDARRKAVIICPGGGYEFCSSREAEPVACQFLAMDCQTFVLDYSVAPAVFPQALRELAASMVLLRERAKEWHIDPNGIYVCGFSAGGHLAASLGTFWNREFAWRGIVDKTEVSELLELPGESVADAAESDEWLARKIRPDGLILSYPVISSGECGHQGSFEHLTGHKKEEETVDGNTGIPGLLRWDFLSLEKQAGSQVPPTFLWHTYTDGTVPAEGSLLYALALKAAGVSLEMHIFPEGRHGLALANEETDKAEDDGRGTHVVPACQAWIPLVKEWLSGRSCVDFPGFSY